mgnify:CR=1 FL=1
MTTISFKKVLIVSMFLILSATTTNALSAQKTCKYDYWGNWICTFNTNNYNSYNNNNYQTTTKKDYWGNIVTTDNRGNRQSCKFDYWGNYVCN